METHENTCAWVLFKMECFQQVCIVVAFLLIDAWFLEMHMPDYCTSHWFEDNIAPIEHRLI